MVLTIKHRSAPTSSVLQHLFVAMAAFSILLAASSPASGRSSRHSRRHGRHHVRLRLRLTEPKRPNIAAAKSVTCAIGRAGQVWCWGQLKNIGLLQKTTRPKSMPALSGSLAIALGKDHSCILKNDGTVWCAGNNKKGQLGNGTTRNSTNLVQVKGLTHAMAVAVSPSGDSQHSCALKRDGTVWCWGDNAKGQLGDGSTRVRHRPRKVRGLRGVVAIALGDKHSCALRNDGTVWCWGDNGHSQVGNGEPHDMGRSKPYRKPSRAKGLSHVIAISANSYQTCALKQDETVWCWGEPGDGSYTLDSETPMQVSGMEKSRWVSVGAWHVCAVKWDGRAWCASEENEDGQVGDATTDSRPNPVLVKRATAGTIVAAGGSHTCMLTSKGTVWCWGANDSGQVGDGTTQTRPTPVLAHLR